MSIFIDFIIVDASTTYNAIFEGPLLNKFKTTVSSYYVAIEFSREGKILTIRGDLVQSRTCYLKEVRYKKLSN